MSVFPNFSNVKPYVREELELRKDNIEYLSGLNSWVRITSAVKEEDSNETGLIIYSNPDYKLFSAAGDDPSIYGNEKLAGTIGKTWGGKAVEILEGQGYRPLPTVQDLTIDDGDDNFSRKAGFSVVCYTLEQMEAITQYLLEPGFTIFLEWGWNTEKALQGFLDEPSAEEIAKFQSFVRTAEKRRDTEGHYDNFLGYITGGGVSMDGDKWVVNVELSGFMELASFFGTNSMSQEDKKNPEVDDFGEEEQEGQRLGIQRFMRMFNELPKTLKTNKVRELYKPDNNQGFVTDAGYYINFDSEIREKINTESDIQSFNIYTEDVETSDGESISIPDGLQLVDNDRYILFGTLMELITAANPVQSYKLGGKDISFKIDSQYSVVSAFPNIYSTDASKLFIPNQWGLKFSYRDFRNQQKINDVLERGNLSFEDYIDNRVQLGGEGSVVKFPEYGNNNPIPEITLPDGTVFQKGGEKDGSRWGYLYKLYVNFDFAMDVLSTPNLILKDALYQILNGMSSAVNGIWDFQIVEVQSERDGEDTTVLKIVDLNFSPIERPDPEDERLVLNVIGSDSILLDSSFDLNLGSMTMNSIIGERNSTPANTETKRVPGLFGRGLTDGILGAIDDIRENVGTQGTDSEGNGEEDEVTEEDIIRLFTKKLTLVPRVEYRTKDDIDTDIPLFKLCYIAAYDNNAIFSLLKSGNDIVEVEDDVPSPLIDINFSFTVHGISGITRGDKFYVRGIPKKFEEGFFQVTKVTHNLSDMNWTTQVEGGFRI